MNERIFLIGSPEDKEILNALSKEIELKKFETKCLYPNKNNDSYIEALSAEYVVICLTTQHDKSLFNIAKARKKNNSDTVIAYLDIVILNPQQEESIEGIKTVENFDDLEKSASVILKDLGLIELSELKNNDSVTVDNESIFKENIINEEFVPPIPHENKEENEKQERKGDTLIIETANTSNNVSDSYAPATSYETYEEPRKKRTGLVIGVIFAVICLGSAIFGWFYYDNVYLPEKIDREAPRTYPIVNVFLRSSKMAGGDFNKIATVPGSDELITYEDDGEWAKVKYIPHGENAKPMVGYVASDYLLNKRDLYQLTSMLSDNDVREVLATSKVRKGLIDYYNRKGITGKISQENAQEVGLPYSPSDQWQVMFHRGQTKPNEVYFKRVYNPDSKFTDMAVIIENVSSGAKKLLYFTYDDDETPHLRAEGDYHNGVIKDMKLDSGVLQIIDKDGQISYYQIS